MRCYDRDTTFAFYFIMLPTEENLLLPPKGRLFIIGAGFSASAGIPMTYGLLSEAMTLMANECPGLYARIQMHARIAFDLGDADPLWTEINFSELCTFLDYIELKEQGGAERWSDEGCRERLVLKHYLAKAIVRRTPVGKEIPELYRQFAIQLRPEDVVITFNWDALLENTMRAMNVRYTYGDPMVGVLLWKMHGSVNWRPNMRLSLFILQSYAGCP